MENSYGIGVRNRYELFYDEDVDPLEIISRAEKKKKDKGPEKENKIKTKENKVLPKSPKNDLSDKSNQDKASGHGNLKTQKTERVKFSDREERNNRRNKADDSREVTGNAQEHQKDKVIRENGLPQQRSDNDARGGRGGGRGVPGFRGGRGARRGGRGGPGNAAGEFRGKREYDRQSGMVTSGVKAVDKRDGSGSYNWGSDKDQIEEQQGQVDNNDLDVSVDNADKAGNEDGTAAGANTDGDANKEEAEQREMTLDEWKALQKREKPQFKIRRAGEGENQAQWKKTYVLKKKEEEVARPVSSEPDSEEEVAEAHHGRKKVFIPIDFQFSDTPTRGRGRGRGGRGGPPSGGGRGRGMGGRGGGRGRFQGGANRQQAPKMDDERDFPSLN